MPNALRPTLRDGAVDAFGAGSFAGVNRQTQPVLQRQPAGCQMIIGRETILRPRQIKPDDAPSHESHRSAGVGE